jgi:hypothetical protein
MMTKIKEKNNTLVTTFYLIFELWDGKNQGFTRLGITNRAYSMDQLNVYFRPLSLTLDGGLTSRNILSQSIVILNPVNP